MPPDNRIELGLDFSLFLGETRSCYEYSAYCYSSLTLDVRHIFTETTRVPHRIRSSSEQGATKKCLLGICQIIEVVVL
jgi:hypothetical protein